MLRREVILPLTWREEIRSFCTEDWHAIVAIVIPGLVAGLLILLVCS